MGNYKVAEMLIFYGAELDYQSSTGATPLHVCAFNNEVTNKACQHWNYLLMF